MFNAIKSFIVGDSSNQNKVNFKSYLSIIYIIYKRIIFNNL